MVCIQHFYSTSQPSVKLGERSRSEVIKSEWKNPEQESFFCWHLLPEKTRSKCNVILLLLRAVPLVQNGVHRLVLHLPQLASTSLINTQPIQGFQIACVAPCPLFCDVLTSMYFPHVTLGYLLKKKYQ